ncbi:MAG: DUF1349 domain-containing protein [Bacillota bacterium]|nr:DUF1349 domain-containing protein [Bacillota bacterium]
MFKEFYWFNEPGRHYFQDGLVIYTNPSTDFWQRTHYGFRRDDGHCLLTKRSGDFSFTAHFEFLPKEMYDQCGIMLRIDEENWIKASVEFENEDISRLGSVVTNLGYSDWATTDITSDVKSMWYRITRKGSDFLIETSYDGAAWTQMRIAHLHKECDAISVGIYACSPKESSFKCRIDSMSFEVGGF